MPTIEETYVSQFIDTLKEQKDEEALEALQNRSYLSEKEKEEVKNALDSIIPNK